MHAAGIEDRAAGNGTVSNARCRLCTANDREALYNDVAAAMWERRRHGTLDDRPWLDAGPYWQTKFLELAEDAVEAMAVDHAHLANRIR